VIFQRTPLFLEESSQLTDIGHENIFIIDHCPVLGLFLGDSESGCLPRTLSILSALNFEIVIPSFRGWPVESEGNHRSIRGFTGQAIRSLIVGQDFPPETFSDGAL